ncbi:MAG: hypothetical protein QM594_12550 [Niabella sp.]
MAIIKLDPTGSGAIFKDGEPFIAGGLNGNLRSYYTDVNEVSLGYNTGEVIIREFESNFRDKDNQPFANRAAILAYVQLNFKIGGCGNPEILPMPVFGTVTKDENSFTVPITNRPDGAAVVWTVDSVIDSETGDTLSKSGLEPDTDYEVTAKFTKAGAIDSQVGTIEITTDAEDEPLEPASYGRTFTLPVESGQIFFDGENFSDSGNPVTLQDKDLFIIPPGNYSYIEIKNINMPAGQRVYFKNGNGLVNFDGSFKSIEVRDVDGCTILGNGSGSHPKGFLFQNTVTRSIKVENINNFTFAYMEFNTGGEDYCIFDETNKVYNPSNPSTWSENVLFTRIKHTNSGQLTYFPGGFDNASDTQLYNIKKNWTVNYCEFNNSDAGSYVSIRGAEDFHAHHLVFNNINPTNSVHSGLIFIEGNGKVHDCYANTYQGNFVRYWNYNISAGANRIAEVYNNKAYNSRMYSAFEISPQFWMYSNENLYHPCNFKVHHNTAGLMNTENYFVGRVLDVYNFPGATGEFYNNLGFQLDDDQLINYASDTGAEGFTDISNNLYFTTAAAAVDNTTDLNSLHAGVGAP